MYVNHYLPAKNQFQQHHHHKHTIRPSTKINSTIIVYNHIYRNCKHYMVNPDAIFVHPSGWITWTQIIIEFHTKLGKPSRVIHIRNIPNDSSESEVIQLGLPFGRVTNVLVLKGKNQAFLEMADEVSAAAMVACFNTNPPQVRGRTVYVQFSNHRELKIDQSHSVIVSINCFCFCFFF